jgi:hypothetical protein
MARLISAADELQVALRRAVNTLLRFRGTSPLDEQRVARTQKKGRPKGLPFLTAL